MVRHATPKLLLLATSGSGLVQHLPQHSGVRIVLKLVLPLAIACLALAVLSLAVLRPASAAGTVRYVAPGGSCGSATPCYSTVQAAVGAAAAGDEIRVAQGIYTDIHTVNSVVQVAYISQSLTLRGGYTTTDWNTSYVSRSTVLDAKGNGRVIYVASGVNATIEGFSLTNGSGVSGGGLYLDANSSAIQNNWVYSNAASSTGGGLYVAGGNPTVRGNAFYSNTAAAFGGGVGLVQEVSLIEGNMIYSNTATGGNDYGGGGIYARQSTATIRRNAIYGNVATSSGGFAYGEGGGILLWNDWGGAQTIIEQNDIHHNTASHRGGGIYVRDGNNLIRNNLVYSNTANSDSGGVHLRQFLSVIVENNTISGNTNDGISVEGTSVPVIRNDILANNSRYGVNADASSVTVNYSLFWNNGSGGPGNNVIVGTGTFTQNPQLTSDLHLQSTSPAIDAADPNNFASSDYAGYPRPFGAYPDMGAYEYYSGTCFARVNGAGPIYADVQSAVRAATQLSDVVRVAGVCQGVSALSLDGSLYTQTLVLTRSLGLRGGYTITDWANSYPLTRPTTFDAQGLGRVVLISATNPVTFESLRLTNGNANLGGGVRVLTGTALISNTSLVANTAGLGGGLYNVSGTVTLLNTTVVSNSAGTLGGGLYNSGGALTVRRSAIYSNTANSGGGLYNAATVAVEANRIYANAATSGGGVYNSLSGSATLQNNMIYTNTASQGGAMYLAGAVSVENNTLYANRATDRGGALYQLGGTMYVTNTLLVSNTAVITAGAVYVSGGTPLLDYNDMFGNQPNDGGSGGTHGISRDPLFVDARMFELHLMPGSPAIDVGATLPWLTTDFDGDARPLGAGYDMGADEVAPTFAPNRTGQGRPGDAVMYTHLITNVTDLGDTFTFTYTNSRSGWAVTPPSSVTLGAHSFQVVTASVVVPSGYLAGTANSTIITATSTNTARAVGAVIDTTSVGQVVSVTMAPVFSSTVTPGAVVTYTHWITNNGNYTDTFSLVLTGPWAGLVTLSPVTLGPALPGYANSQVVVITVSVPLTAPAFLTTTAVLQAVSSADALVSAQVADVTTAKAVPGTRYVRMFVNGGNDSFNNCTQPDSPCATVQHAVEQAADGDTVQVAGGFYQGGELRINKNITLLGGFAAGNWTAPRDPVFNLTVLDGNSTDRVIYIPGYGLQPAIDGFTIQYGHANGIGGGLYVELYAQPRLTNVKFHNNSADSRGGAIYIQGGSLYLERVVFDGNTAAQGAGVYNAGANLVISATQFLANGSASTQQGGALYHAGGSLNVMSHSELRGNTAQQGGGIYHLGGGLVVTNSLMVTNTATGNGGGLYVSASAATFLNNIVYSNTAGGNGGGLYFGAGTVLVENNTLYGNVATGMGGAIYDAQATAMVTNNIMVQNAASLYGALYAAATLSADYNDAWGNTPNDSNVSLGAHSLAADPLFTDVSSGNFSLMDLSPAVDKGDPNTTLIYDYNNEPRPAGQGYDMGAFELGGCYARVNHLGVDGPIFLNVQDAINTVQLITDVVKVAGTCRGVHPLQVGSTTIYQTVHLTQSLILRGGYSINIWNDPPQAGPAVLDAQERGRAIYVSEGVSPFIENMVLRHGTATNLGGGPGGQDAGGALYNSGGSAVVSNTMFINGSAAFGGGLYNGDGGVLTLTQSALIQNAATQGGGGAYNYNGQLILSGSTITANMSSANGGGVYNSVYGTLTVSRTAVVNNQAITGGGLYDDSGTASLQANVIRANIASDSGGGLYVKGGPVAAQNNMVYGNRAMTGGGAYLAGGTTNASFNTWYDNTADDNGGAIYSDISSTLNLNNSILIGNTALNGSNLFNRGTATLDYNDMSSDNPGSIFGAVVGAHSFFADPWFASASTGDLHLREGSPAMDRGDPNATLLVDWEGDIRPSMYGFDVGADEIGGCYVRLNEGTTTYGSVPHVIAMSRLPTDTVKIAGRCVGVQPVLDGGAFYTQTVYLTKTLTLRGGYSPTNWLNPDPSALPTYFDALGLGRVLVISGSITPTIDGLVLVNGTAALAGGPNAGGGVYVVSGAPVFSSTTIVSSTAQLGGGLYASGVVAFSGGSVFNNAATASGGGFYNSSGTLTVYRSTLYSNIAPSGGGLYNAGTAYVKANKIYTNTATSGGGVYNASGVATLQNNMLYDNSAGNGGAVYLAGGNATVEHNTLYGNHVATQGSGIYNAATATVRITSTLVVSNVAGTGGSGIYNSGGATSLDYNDVISNTPNNYSSGVVTGSHSLAVDPLFVNTALYDLHLSSTSPVIDKGDPASTLTEDFEGDPRPGLNGFDIGADELGGCLARNNRTGITYGSVQRAHDAAQSGDLIQVAGYCWGVQTVSKGTQTFTQTLYVDRSLTFRGGYSPSDWSQSHPISYPTTLDARGWGRVVYISTTQAVVLESMLLFNGKSALDGGGVYNLSAALTLSHTTLYSNTAAGKGGAVYNNGGQPTLQGNVVYSNTATDGGAFYHASGSATLQNNVMYLNVATNRGGAVFVASGSASMLNNTLHANRAATGGAVYNASPGSVQLVNTILANNTATTTSGGLHDSLSLATVDYDDWWNNSPNNTNAVTGTHSVITDPLFVNQVNGDLHLQMNSPAIDVGNSALMAAVDMDDEPRPMQNGVDIGADEVGGCYARANHLGYDYPIRYNVQDAIADATLPTDTVKVAGYCFGVRTVAGGRQTAYINQALTVRGGYTLTNWTTSSALGLTGLAVLDARGQGRVIYVGPYDVTVDGFDIRNGDASQAGAYTTVGGGVLNNGGNLTLHNSWIQGNRAVRGGGVYHNGGYTFFAKNAAVGNTAMEGAGLYVNGGHVDTDGNPTINCDFESNIASGNGGAAYVNNGGYLRPINVVLWTCRNTAAGDGGGFYVANGTLDISTYYWFYHNTASTGSGGGVYVGNAGNIVFNAQAGVDQYRFESNVAGTHGGALYVDGGNVSMLKVILTNNSAASGNGGGIYQTGTGQAAIYNALAVSNTAPSGNGGAFYNDNGSLIVVNGTVVSNTASNAGGGFYSAGGALAVTNTILMGNAATAPTSQGGAIRCNGGVCSENYNDYFNNHAASENDRSGTSGGAGDIFLNPQFVNPVAPDPNYQWAFYSSGYMLLYTSPAIDAGTTAPEVWEDAASVLRPQGTTWDMGRYEFPGEEAVQVSNSTLYANPGQTVVHVNAITNKGKITDTFTISASGPWLTGVSATTTPPLGPDQSAIVVITVTVPVTATTCDSSVITKHVVSHRNSNVYGEGMDTTYVNLVPIMSLTPDPNTSSARPGETITYTHVISNNSNTCGPSQFLVSFVNSQYSWSSLSTPTVITVARGTTATVDVQVNLYSWAPVNAVDQATVKAALAVSPTNYVIAADNTTILPWPGTRYVASNGKDDSNCSDAEHGACATIQYAVSQAAPGDEIHVAQGIYTGTLSLGKSVNVRGGYTTTNWLAAPAPLRQPTVLDAQNAGRVISMSGSITPTVTGVSIVNGNATDGGGIYADVLTATLGANLIHSNTATNGGGVYVRAGNVVLQNNVLYSNSSSNGGAVYVGGGAARMENNTLYGNQATANGGGVYNASGATLGLTNTIVASNLGGGYAIYNNGGSVALDYDDVWNNSSSDSNVPTGTHSLSANPQFVNAGAGDFHLTAISPAVDHGVALSLTTDFEGDTRPQIAGYDIGADELSIMPTLLLTPPADERHTISGPVYYQHILTNSGNYTDTVTLSAYVNQSGWGVSVAPSPTVTLGAGRATTVYVTITVPAGTLTGTVGVATITATSGLSASVYARAVDTTYYQEDSNVAIGKRVTPAAGWLGPGMPVTYTLIYSTSGPSSAVGVVITDLVPVTLTSVAFASSGPAISQTTGITYTWTVTTFNVGQVGLITITGKVKPQGLPPYVGLLTNTTTITTVQRDATSSNNTAWATSLLDTSPPNVSGNPLFSPPNGTLTTSQAITFTWLPYNDKLGTVDGSGVVSYQLVISSVQGSGFYTSVTVYSPTTSLAMFNLPSNNAYTWTVRAFDAVGNASAYAPASSLAVGFPILTIGKQTAPVNPVRGAQFGYNLTITNAGLIPATSTVVTDALPSNVTYVSGGLFDGSVITWTNVTVGPNSTAQVNWVASTCQVSVTNASYRVASTAEGVGSSLGVPLVTTLVTPTIAPAFSQSASIVGLGDTVYLTTTIPVQTDGGAIVAYGWNLGDGQTATGSTASHVYTTGGVFTVRLIVTDTCGFTQSVTGTVTVMAPSISLTKSAPSAISPGGPLTYTLIVTNSGLNNLTGVVLTDTLPANIVGGYALPAPDGGNSSIVAGSTVTWTLGSMGIGAVQPVMLVVTVTSPLNSGTVLTNTARVTTTQGTSDVASATTTVSASPVLVITKHAPASVWVATPITYTINYTNAGLVNAHSVVITDALPMNIVGGYATPAPAGGAIGAGQVITWNVPYLAGLGDHGSITLVVTVTNVLPNGTVLTNTAGMASAENATATTGPVTTTVISAPRLVLVKSNVPAGIVSLGDRITYTLWVSNTGTEEADNVVITDTTPANTTFVSAGFVSPAAGTINGPAVGGAGAVIWNLTTPITIGTSAAVTLTVRVTTGPLDNNTPIVNSGYSAMALHATGLATGAPVTNTVRALPSLTITKSAPAAVIANTPLTYTIRYTDTGDGNATGVVITDALPSNISGGYAAPAPSSGVVTAGQVITWTVARVTGQGGTGMITLVVTPTQSFYGTLLNTAGIVCSDGISSFAGPVLVLTSHGAPATLAISPQGVTLRAGMTQPYTVTATDGFGNAWYATSEVTFTAPSGGVFGTPPGNNVFTATTPLGTHVITVTASNGAWVTTTVNVMVGTAVSITIYPRDATVTAGQSLAYTSTISDVYGNSGDGTSFTTFAAGGGNTFGGNVLSATVAGTWVVTGTSASASDTTSVNILPGPASRLGIGSVTTQTAGVGFTIVVTAYDGFGNVVTGFTGAISLTDSTGTLSPVTWSTWSNGQATPVVTVTRAIASDLITATLAATPTIYVVSAPFAVVPNVPATLTLGVNPTAILLGATSQLTSTVRDAFANLVANGTVVTFTTTSGTFANGLPVYAGTTTSGVATAVLTSTCSASAVTLTAQAGSVLTQTGASFVAPGIPASLTLALGSNVLPVGGVTTALTATLRDCGNNLLGSGIPISFTLMPISAAVAPNPAATVGGVASATLTSPQTAGSTLMTAWGGGLQAQATITFTPLAPYTVTVVAMPSVISPTWFSNIRATVTDQYNNAVADGTSVAFEATLGSITPAITQTLGGLASAVFTAGASEGKAVITATAGSGVRATTVVTITLGRFYVYLPLVMCNYPPIKNLTVSAITSSSQPANVNVVVQNAGNIAITESFWVILYLDPTQTIQINKFWWQVGSPNGAAWQVTKALQPGETLTLWPPDASPPYAGYWPTSFTRGQHALWAQVDGWAASGTTGLVQETNEDDNIRGPVTFTVP